jgi:hypothetical protein
MKINKVLSVLVGIAFVATSCSSAIAATPKPTASKKATSSKTSTKVSSKTTKQVVNGINIANYGYKGKKDPSDVDVPPTLTLMTGVVGVNSDAFKLEEIASASTVLNLIIKDLADANIKCDVLPDPTVSPVLKLYGSVKTDTLAACQSGDPRGTGFIEYIFTSKDAIAQFDTADGIKQYLSYSSPVASSLGQTEFTPSSRAIIFTAGGEYAFDANEISWATLFNRGYTPPKR